MTFTLNIFLAFHNLFMMLVHMEVHLKGYFLMRIQSEFEAGLKDMKFINSLQSFSIAAAVFFGGRLFITAIKLHVKIIGGMRKKKSVGLPKPAFFQSKFKDDQLQNICSAIESCLP